jgi:hypothetical protein
MILIGMFDCPFVRRVAVSLRLLGVPFQHRNWSVVRDFELIRQFNPLGRVPALVQPDGEPLIDSTAILDFLDARVGPERALLPPAGDERRRALHIISLALGAANKSMLLIDETLYRPEEKRYSARTECYRNQMHGALAEIDRLSRMRRRTSRSPACSARGVGCSMVTALRPPHDAGGHHTHLRVQLSLRCPRTRPVAPGPRGCSIRASSALPARVARRCPNSASRCARNSHPFMRATGRITIGPLAEAAVERRCAAPRAPRLACRAR